MEGLSAAASVVAVVQIAAEVAKLCGGYLHDVKHAAQDIERMKAKAVALHDVLERLNNTPESKTNEAAIQQCFHDLKSLKEKLEPKRKHAAMKRFGMRALTWPFSSNEADERMKVLEGYLLIFSTALELDISDKVGDAEQERVLERLAYVADASFDSYENQRHHTCHAKTRVEVLRQIMQWATTSPQCIFWLRGMAGTGKSTVAITVASQPRHITNNVASYFFQRGLGDLAHARKMISTIVWQLSHSSLSYRQLVLAAVKEKPDLGHSANLREQYEKLIVGPLSKLQSLTPTHHTFFIVIDALDECDEVNDLRLLLRLFATTKNMLSLGIRVFVTSRPEVPIRLGFQEMPSILHQDLILHDVPRSVVDGDIKIFLSDKLKDVQQKYCLPAHWPEDSKLSTLIAKAEGLFIFAETACRYIGGSPQVDPQERLEQVCSSISKNQLMTEELDQMYTIILKNSVKGKYAEAERQRISSRFRQIVGGIVVLLNPLSIPELFKLLCNAQLQAQYQLENTLEPLHAVLDIPEDIGCSVQPLHLSFRDFLLDQNRCPDDQFWVNEKQTHHKLAMDCMRLLSSSLRRNPCHLPSLGTKKTEIARKDVDNALSPAVQYACRYWADHAQKGKVELLDHGCIHKVLKQHFLHWLEAMSLMGKISEAIIAITNIAAIINSQESPIMHDLIHDCRRFLLAFRHAITDAPEQIYASALIFSPLHTTVRNLFKDIIPQWTKVQPLHQEKWSSSLQTLEGHTGGVYAVVFSPDGQLVASGSSDDTLRLWDAQTGECCSILEGYSASIANVTVTFSPDGQLIASGSHDHTVRIWDAQTGECCSLLEGHSEEVKNVVFSPDGQLVASGSADHTVRLWNAQTGECCSLLEGHSEEVKNVVFSPDGQLIASGSHDHTVRLWDAQSGECCSLLEGHTGWVLTVVFSPDGQLVASGSRDYTVRLWDVQTGECHSLLKGHSGFVETVVFSPDGQLVASGSYDDTVRLWNAQTGECHSLLKGHSSLVETVVFSPDGQLVASGSADHTVRLWNAQTGECHSLLIGHSELVRTVVFSPDGQLVASGSYDHTVRLWNAQAGECHSLLKGHSSLVKTVVFSPDGQLVASGSADHTVRLWNAQTGECRSVLEGHIYRVDTVAFSPDGQLVASGSDDCIVRLWNAQTGECRSVLEGHTDGVDTVAFSPDCQLVASGSKDRIVRLWNAQTGECRSVLEGHTGEVDTVAFSPDCQLVASGSDDLIVRLWNAQTGECCSLLEGHTDWVYTVVFSPDGQLVASASCDHTVRLWDVQTGECCSLLEGHSDSVRTVVFSPDGRIVASGSDDHTVRLWDAATGEHVSTIPYLSSIPQIEFHTGLGLIFVDGTAFEILSGKMTKAVADKSNCPTSYLNANGDWLMKSSERVLWLPPEYRPRVHASYGNITVLGLTNGQIYFISLEDGVDSQIDNQSIYSSGQVLEEVA